MPSVWANENPKVDTRFCEFNSGPCGCEACALPHDHGHRKGFENNVGKDKPMSESCLVCHLPLLSKFDLYKIFSLPELIVIGPSSVSPSIRSQLQKKKSSSPKVTHRFQLNFTEMILRSRSLKILQRIEFRKELWLPWQQIEKNFKNLLVPNCMG